MWRLQSEECLRKTLETVRVLAEPSDEGPGLYLLTGATMKKLAKQLLNLRSVSRSPTCAQKPSPNSVQQAVKQTWALQCSLLCIPEIACEDSREIYAVTATAWILVPPDNVCGVHCCSARSLLAGPLFCQVSAGRSNV